MVPPGRRLGRTPPIGARVTRIGARRAPLDSGHAVRHAFWPWILCRAGENDPRKSITRGTYYVPNGDSFAVREMKDVADIGRTLERNDERGREAVVIDHDHPKREHRPRAYPSFGA